MCCGTSDIGMTCLPLSMMNTCMDEKSIYFSIICCRSWLAVNVLWHKWHWNDLSSTLHDEHLYGWKILHRSFQFSDILNFITTRYQQLFANHLLLNITLLYALLHGFFLKNQTKTGLGPVSGVRSGSGLFQSGPVATLPPSKIQWKFGRNPKLTYYVCTACMAVYGRTNFHLTCNTFHSKMLCWTHKWYKLSML